MQPQIIVFVPVFVLRRSKLGSQSLASRTTVLVNDDSVFQKPPCAIDDLRARLHGDGAVGAGNLVLHEFDVVWLQPTKLAIHLDPLLGMDHTIVNDPFDLQLVRLCRVSMENHDVCAGACCRVFSTLAS